MKASNLECGCVVHDHIAVGSIPERCNMLHPWARHFYVAAIASPKNESYQGTEVVLGFSSHVNLPLRPKGGTVDWLSLSIDGCKGT